MIKDFTFIDENAFYGCEALEVVIIPLSVEIIERNAFLIYRDYNAVHIYCEASEKPAGWHENWVGTKSQVTWNYKDGIE